MGLKSFAVNSPVSIQKYKIGVEESQVRIDMNSSIDMCTPIELYNYITKIL